jgi:unsaturated chondroitin disaccharide hydrolase
MGQSPDCLYPAALRRDWEAALQNAIRKIERNLVTFHRGFPAPASRNNVYPEIANIDWTAGFWPGLLWLAYEATWDDQFSRAATAIFSSFAERLEKRIHIDHHELGFLYTLSALSRYKLTGKENARSLAIRAADHLLARYHDRLGIIQAWGDIQDPQQQGRLIIDGLMNLPLLYWAGQTTGDSRFYRRAYRHARQSAIYLVRDDFSTVQTAVLDPESGVPRDGNNHQGYGPDSCWARGQAWGIYGFGLSYVYTEDWSFIELAKGLADYFLARLPQDRVCYWDLIFTGGNEPRDSSAAAVALCGLLELVRHLPLGDPDKARYEAEALAMLASLTERYATRPGDDSNGLLRHAVYHKPKGIGVDECCLWGDYFYLEALIRVTRNWKRYW